MVNVVNGSFRQAGIAAAAASAAWMFQSLASLALPDPTKVLDLTMIAPMALTVVAVWRLRQTGAIGGRVLTGVCLGVGAVSAAGIVPGQLAFAFDWGTPGDIAKAVSTVAFIGLLLAAGVGVFRARVLPRWVGGALVAAQPLAVLFGLLFSPISPLSDSGDYTGALGHGIVWGLIGAALLGKRIPFLNEPAAPIAAPVKP